MIVKILQKIQKERKLTDKQLAESLDIHTQSWSQNKRTRTISSGVLLRAFEVYPELRERFLASFENSGEKQVAENTTPYCQSHQDGKIRGFIRDLVDFLKVWF